MAKFIMVSLGDKTTQEEIMFLLEDGEQLKQAVALYLGSAPKQSIKPMLKKYIATDKSLTDLERLHAFCWSACFLRQSKLFQKNSKLNVAWTFHDDIESLAKHQQEYNQNITNLGGQLIFRTESAE